MKREIKISLLLILGLLVLICIGLSFGYFVANVKGDGKTNITVDTGNNASLIFVKGKELSINASIGNFSDGMASLSDDSTSSVILTSDSYASEKYNVYFKIDKNDFEYTTSSSTPELVLNVVDPSGDELKSIDGLTYTTKNGVNGFDLTTTSGLITIKEDYSITTNDSTTHNWVFTLKFVNLNSNQNDNNGKTFESSIVLQQDKMKQDEVSYLKDVIIENEGGVSAIEAKEIPNFSNISYIDEGMYSTYDNDGVSYYFRGAVEDNYVEFNNMLWRIVRIDGMGNIKLVLYNTDVNATNYLDNGIGTFSFSNTDSLDYNDSICKIKVDEWYKDNISDMEDYLFKGKYCVDMSIVNSQCGAYDRLYINKEPSLLCNTNSGALEYSYYSGVLSADEISLAGTKIQDYGISNENFYLYTDYHVSSWTCSPHRSNYDTSVFKLSDKGGLDYYYTWSSEFNSALPTIYLKSNVVYNNGDGSKANPYSIIY